MIDLILIGSVAVFFLMGYTRGLLRQASGVVRFIISAAAAYVYYKNDGALLGIFLVFALTNLVLAVVFRRLLKLRRKKDEGPSSAGRIAGGVFGGLEGIIYALVALVFLHLLSGAIAAANPNFAKHLENSYFYARYKAIGMASKIPAVKETYRIGELLNEEEVVLDPQVVNQLEQNPSIQAALRDEELVESLKQKDYGAIISNPKFLNVLKDKELVKQLVGIGIQGKAQVATGDKPIDSETSHPKQAGNLLDGILYFNGGYVAVINGEIYQTGSKVCGGKIAQISQDKMTLEFPDRREDYRIGEDIP